MSTRQYETISHKKIYGLKKIRTKKTYSNYEISSRLKTMKDQYSSDIYQGNTSTILNDYEQSLKTELQSGKMRQLQRKERKKLQTIQNLVQDQKKSRNQSKRLISQLQSIKYRLKTISLERESDFRMKQRAVLIKHALEGQNRNYPILPNLSAHLHYPYSYSYPTKNPPYPPYQPMQNSQIYAPQSYQRNFSQPAGNPRKKTQSLNASKNNYNPDQLLNENKKLINKPNDQKIITKTQFNRDMFKKRNNDFKRFQNKQANIKKLRKCFLAVYFSVVLKRTYLKIVKQRKNFFYQFWPQQFFKFQETFKEFSYAKLLPFFKLLKEKQYTSLIPTQQDTKVLQLEKKKTVRELVRLFFECLKAFKKVQNLGSVAWGFCTNGSFADKGVLTVSQMQFVCFNQTHGYLRMDLNLEKSQIISFIFIKIILFKILLHPWKKWTKQYNPSQNNFLFQNLKLVASILYDLFVTLQDQYMSSANLKLYPVGNYNEVKRINDDFSIEFSKPLLYETKKAEKEIISGLYSQQFLKKNIGFKKILPNLQIAKQVIEGIHHSSKQYDRLFRSKVLKFVPKVNYKY